jgi:2'-hydroxyisoflavone reductase
VTATFSHVTSEFLAARKVNPWSDLPVWVPPDGDTAGFTLRSIAKALG